MYQTKTMKKLKMIPCPKCGNPMPLKRKELGYNVCVNCSTVSAKRGVPVMRGTGDHTWVDLEVMTQDQFERYEEMENKTKTEITPNRNEDRNLQGPFTILETDK